MIRVFIAGGTGFIGSYIIDELLNHGYQPVLLVREGSVSRVAQPESCEILTGNVLNPATVQEAIRGCEAVIYTVGLLREFPSKGLRFEDLHYQGAVHCMDQAVKAGISRFLLMSANGVKPGGTKYQSTKYQAEEYLKSLPLDWTVFRPSIMFGDPRGRMEFMTQVKEQIVDPFFPAPAFFRGINLFQGGNFEFSPIHVMDVAKCFVLSINETRTQGKTYELGGPQIFSWKEIIGLIARTLDREKWFLPVPVWGLWPAAALLDRYPFFPATREQLTMLLEGNTCNSSEVFNLLNIDPVPLNKENLRYLVH